MSNTGFRFGEWEVDLAGNAVSNGDLRTPLEPRVMQVLRYLCRHPGAVIPAEELLQACWGNVELGDNPVHKAITQLRRALGDSSTDPRYIETIRKRGYRAIATVVEAADSAPAGWTGGSPFRGLEAFQENHAAIFFGRVAATAQLRAIVTAQAAAGCAMALLLGPSGSGKTSLVRAGLLPQLMQGAARPDEPIMLTTTTYLDCADVGGGSLLQGVAAALLDADLNDRPLFEGDSAASLGRQLETDAAGVALRVRERTGGKVQVALFVDRLEAIFRSPQVERVAFIEVLETLARSGGMLVMLACRNDFYPDIVALPALMALKARGGHFDLTPPDGAEIAQIVRQPARAAQLSFEQDPASGASLDDVLCDAARGSPDTLPLLQYCLHELYRLRSEDGMLRFAAFSELGGIEGAIGVRAEQVVAALKPEQVAALPHVLSLLVNIGDEQAAVTARRSPWSLLRNDAEKELVRVMVEARLFVSELAGEVPSFGVAHEALLRRWPRVAEWIERYRHALQLRTRISGQAARWAEAGRARDLLLPRGIQVSQATELLTLEDFSLAPLETDFIRASIQRARLGERIRNGVIVLIALLAILSTTLGLMARSAQRDAELNRAEADDIMTYMLGDFVEKLRPIGRLDLLDDVGSKAIAYLGKNTHNADNGVSLHSRVKALRLIAEVHFNRGRPKEGAATLASARELLLAAAPALQKYRPLLKERGINAYLLGHMYLTQNELDKAQEYFTEYLQFSTRYSEADKQDIDGWIEQSYAHNSLGSLAMTRSDFTAAAKEFDASLKMKRRALESKPGQTALNADIANSVSWLAESKLKLGDTQGAMTLYREEEALLRPIHESNASWSNRLSLSLMRQALLLVAFGDKQQAIAKLQDARKNMQSIVDKDPSNRLWQSRLLQAEGRLVELQASPDNAAASLANLQAICDKLNALIGLEPKNTFLIYQTAKFEHGRTVILRQLGKDAAARANADQAVNKFEGLYQKAKKDNILLGFLADALLTRADLDPRNRQDCDRAAELLSAATPHTNDYSLLALQVRAHLCMGATEQVQEQMQQLQRMGYRDARYQQYVSTHPFMKGKQ